MTVLINDLRYALRQLKKTRGLTLICIATLALGIGANTAVFSVMNAVLLKSLPVEDPDRVVYLGTASKTLAPGIRLGWLVVPAALTDAVVEAKLLDDLGSSTIEQLALARLLETAAYDRHLRKARRRNRARRDALIASVGKSLPRARVSGISAGLHALLRLPRAVDAHGLLTLAGKRSLGVYPLSLHMIDPPALTDALVLGYASLTEPAIEEGVRRLAAVLAELE